MITPAKQERLKKLADLTNSSARGQAVYWCLWSAQQLLDRAAEYCAGDEHMLALLTAARKAVHEAQASAEQHDVKPPAARRRTE